MRTARFGSTLPNYNLLNKSNKYNILYRSGAICTSPKNQRGVFSGIFRGCNGEMQVNPEKKQKKFCFSYCKPGTMVL